MEILKMNVDDLDLDTLDYAVHILSEGGVVIYPTDTVYGLGVNIFDGCAVKKVYKLKKRNENKPVSACFSSIKSVLMLAGGNKKDVNILNKNLPGPFTFVMYKKRGLGFKFFNRGSHKIGIRIPESKIAIELSKIFPITATSANKSSMGTLSTPKEIAKQLDHDVDLAIDVGPLKSDKFSTVVDLTKSEPTILREGVGNLII
ncbi:MAG: threonylcarbamoyl-AMP synthase [Methanobrevibacter sp.]|jgi:L-threonylcarbamoyladenylate synthase|nr:threonylcarbamoyl-AMP synthase [Candidatus Methanovirga aequatorialis]